MVRTYSNPEWRRTTADRKLFQSTSDHDSAASCRMEHLRERCPGRRVVSAWIGLVPKQHRSGGKDNLGSISKQGDRYLRSLVTAGVLAVIRYAKIHGTKHRPQLAAMLARRPITVAAIALANKIARMAWAMMARGEHHKEPLARTCAKRSR